MAEKAQLRAHFWSTNPGNMPTCVGVIEDDNPDTKNCHDNLQRLFAAAAEGQWRAYGKKLGVSFEIEITPDGVVFPPECDQYWRVPLEQAIKEGLAADMEARQRQPEVEAPVDATVDVSAALSQAADATVEASADVAPADPAEAPAAPAAPPTA